MIFHRDLILTAFDVYVKPQKDSLRIREPKAAKEKPKRIDVHRIPKPNLRTMKQR